MIYDAENIESSCQYLVEEILVYFSRVPVVGEILEKIPIEDYETIENDLLKIIKGASYNGNTSV